MTESNLLPSPNVDPSSAVLVPQIHGGAILTGGVKGNRGHILRKRKQYAAWIAAGILIQRMKDAPGAIETKDVIAAAKLDGDRLEVEAGKSAQDTESGEAAMQRVMAMVGRAVLAAPAAQRVAILAQIEAATNPTGTP